MHSLPDLKASTAARMTMAMISPKIPSPAAYICLRLMEGADICQIAKNCRISVEMIEKFYAAHIKNMIDAAAVNVRRNAADAAPSKRGANAKRPKPQRREGYPKQRA